MGKFFRPKIFPKSELDLIEISCVLLTYLLPLDRVGADPALETLTADIISVVFFCPLAGVILPGLFRFSGIGSGGAVILPPLETLRRGSDSELIRAVIRSCD